VECYRPRQTTTDDREQNNTGPLHYQCRRASNNLHVCVLLNLKDASRLPPTQTVGQCYGKQISAKCELRHLMRIVSATYRRSRDCVGGASDLPLLGGGNESLTTGCSRDNVSGPPCVGNGSCIFTAPWIYISADCGYSNYFSLRYQCVPGMKACASQPGIGVPVSVYSIFRKFLDIS